MIERVTDRCAGSQNRKDCYEEIHKANGRPLQENVTRGLLNQLVNDERIRIEHASYVSYVVGEHDWEGLEGMAWDYASGPILDTDMVNGSTQ